MTSPDNSAVQHLLPQAVIGAVTSIVPVRLGLSGAGVYAVSTARGDYILRVQGQDFDESFWRQHLLILRRAAESGVAPPIVHVDELARAIISVRIGGVPLPAVLVDPARRQPAIADIVARLRALHTIDPSGVTERDAVRHLRALWDTQYERDGFPAWGAPVESLLGRLESILASDSRRVVSHNDVNPGNVLWDGSRSWLVDWEVAGLGHPYYDLAAFVTFLNLDAEPAYQLLALQEQSVINDSARATFDLLRKLVALLVGNIFLSMVPDLGVVVAPARADAPTLPQCWTAMRAGEMDLQTARGQAMFGLAFLRIGTEG